jgi:glucokinase
MRLAIGIDLGGTFIKAGLVRLEDGAVLERMTVPTRDGEWDVAGVPAFVSGVRECVAKLEARAGGDGLRVGLSAPGLAEREGRAIRWMPGRMEGIEGLDWSAALGRPVRVLNDAQAALLGEVWTGAGRGCQDVIMLTLGTGVGGAIFAGGRLLTGGRGQAGHLGHISVDADGAPDACGMPGSVELAMGNLTIQQRTGGRFDTTHALVAAAAAGDAEAQGWWQESVRRLAVAVASVIHVLDPERVIVGGGIATGAGALLFDPLRRFLDAYEWRPDGIAVPVVLAEAGEWAGVLGTVWDKRLCHRD